MKIPNLLKLIISKNYWNAFLILVFGIVLTLTYTWYTHHIVKKQKEQEFSDVCSDIITKIHLRLHSHAGLLRGGAAFFESVDTVTNQQWKNYNKKSRIDLNLPGIQGLGFSLIIAKDQLQKHIALLQSAGFPEYTVHPEGDRDLYTSIIYLEPFTVRNRRAFGYDMFSEPIRKKAMESARDSNIAALSGKVILVQETKDDIQAGTLMYVPVYKKGLPINNVDQRRAAIKGWVYSSYRMNDLMQGILGRWDILLNNRIQLQVYDENVSANSLLYNSQHQDTLLYKDSKVRYESIHLKFNNKKWIFNFTQYEDKIGFFQGEVLIVFMSGITISFLLFFLMWSVFSTLSRANEIAKELTKDLKESEERFKNMFKNHSSIMLLIEPESGNIVEANDAASKFYGYSIPELCGMSINQLNILSQEQIKTEMNKAIIRKRNHFIFTHKLASGLERIVEVHTSPINYGKSYMLFSIIHDITERKQAEEALKVSQDRWKFALEGSNDGVWDWNLQTNEVYFSKQWKAMLGFEENEISNNLDEWSKRVHPEELEKCYADIQMHLDGKVPLYSNIHRAICKNGTYKWILDRGKIIDYDENKKPIKMVGTHTDLTEQIELENELVKLNADKDRFISILAHDLKSPFNSILGLLDILQNNIHTYDIDKIEKFLSMINSSAKKTFNLLEDILMWVKANSGKLPYEPQMLSFMDCCSGIIENLELTANNKNISLDCFSNGEIFVFADRNMLNAILRNLISNAIKFTNENGKITVNAEKNNLNVTITVADNGVGISDESLSKLFEISEIISTKGTANETGTGIGLLLSKEFVENHSGKIWVESEFGIGSKFIFTLPLGNKIKI